MFSVPIRVWIKKWLPCLITQVTISRKLKCSSSLKLLALGSSQICGLLMYLFQFSLTKSPSRVTHITDTGENGLLNLRYCFWDYFSETVATDASLVSSFSCFTSYKHLLISQEKNKWPQMLFSKSFNTVHMIQTDTEEYLVIRNYWHPR